MKRNWIFWLVRIFIYAAIAAILIWIHNANECISCPTISHTQSTILTIGKIFGVGIILIELMFIVGRSMRKSNES